MGLDVYFRTIDDTTLQILRALRDYRYKAIKYWVNSRDISNPRISSLRDLKQIKHDAADVNLTCYHWNRDSQIAEPLYGDGLEHLISRVVTYGTGFVCIDPVPRRGKLLALFQDCNHNHEYPKEFIKIPCFDNFEDLIAYAVAQGHFRFSLETDANFERTNMAEQGAPVFKEKSTGQYWYIDNLHKTHYEVFNHLGDHLGEADLEGNLDTGKKDKRKRINP